MLLELHTIKIVHREFVERVLILSTIASLSLSQVTLFVVGYSEHDLINTNIIQLDIFTQTQLL